MMKRYEAPEEWVAYTRSEHPSPPGRWIWLQRAASGFLGSHPVVGLELLTVEGRLEASAIQVRSFDENQPLSRDDLKELPLRLLLDRANELEIEKVVKPSQGRSRTGEGGTHPGRRGYAHSEYERFAEHYKRARPMFDTKNRALKALSGPYGRNPSTLYRWVDKCKDLGLLDEEDAT